MNENEIITKDFFESPAYQAKRVELLKEINANPNPVDYKIFKQMPSEKDKTLEMKLKNKMDRKKHYGSGLYKKYLNTPGGQMEVVQWFSQTDKFFGKTFEGPIKMTF